MGVNTPLVLIIEIAIDLEWNEVGILCLLLPETIFETDDMLQVDGAPLPLEIQVGNGRCALRKSLSDQHSRIMKRLLSLIGGHEVLEGCLDKPVEREGSGDLVPLDERKSKKTLDGFRETAVYPVLVDGSMSGSDDFRHSETHRNE